MADPQREESHDFSRVEDVNRRRLLFASVSVSTLALAGCLGDGDGDDTGSDDDSSADGVDSDGSTDDEGTTIDIPGELPTNPVEDDFVDRTGEDVVEVITRWGEGSEPEFIFDPPFVRVDEGTTIRWVNTDGVFHTVTSTDSLDNRSGGGAEFNATISSEGDEFEWVADETGRQDYYCSPHAGFMYGSIDVI